MFSVGAEYNIKSLGSSTSIKSLDFLVFSTFGFVSDFDELLFDGELLLVGELFFDEVLFDEVLFDEVLFDEVLFVLVVVTGFVLYLYVKLALFIVHSSSLNVIEQKAVPLLDDGALTDRIFQFKLHVHTLQYTDLTLIVHDQHRPSLAQKSSITFQTFCVSVEVIVVHKNPAIL